MVGPYRSSFLSSCFDANCVRLACPSVRIAASGRGGEKGEGSQDNKERASPPPPAFQVQSSAHLARPCGAASQSLATMTDENSLAALHSYNDTAVRSARLHPPCSRVTLSVPLAVGPALQDARCCAQHAILVVHKCPSSSSVVAPAPYRFLSYLCFSVLSLYRALLLLSAPDWSGPYAPQERPRARSHEAPCQRQRVYHSRHTGRD